MNVDCMTFKESDSLNYAVKHELLAASYDQSRYATMFFS